MIVNAAAKTAYDSVSAMTSSDCAGVFTGGTSAINPNERTNVAQRRVAVTDSDLMEKSLDQHDANLSGRRIKRR